MRLLHFAHRGEASEFLSYFKLKPLEFYFAGLYQGEDFLLLISGEGEFETLSKLSSVLGSFKQIDKIINLGIAGGLDKKLLLDKIYSIRSVYAFDKDIRFKSFSSNGDFDCVTASERVLDREFAKKIAPFGAITDRELWAVGVSAKHHGIPFESYKLISDYAGNTNCFDLKLKAQEFSKALLKHYLSLDSETLLDSNDNLEIPREFYCSFTQEKKIISLIHSLRLKYRDTQYNPFKTQEVENIKNLDLLPKEKTRYLINFLEDILNPIKKDIKLALNNFEQELSKIGAKCSFDKELEKSEFKISMNINSQKNIDNLAHKLTQTKFKNFEKIMHGDLSV